MTPSPDTVMVTWQPELVNEFNNSPFIAPPDNFIVDNFSANIIRIPTFFEEVSLDKRDSEFLCKLMAGMSDKKVGFYSACHDNAVYAFGYNDERTIRLAYM